MDRLGRNYTDWRLFLRDELLSLGSELGLSETTCSKLLCYVLEKIIDSILFSCYF